MYEIGQTAYVKIVLHALKHPNNSVSGVLVGKVTGSSTSENSETGFRVDVIDAVPLFHGQHGLLPSLELSLSQVLCLKSFPSMFRSSEPLGLSDFKDKMQM